MGFSLVLHVCDQTLNLCLLGIMHHSSSFLEIKWLSQGVPSRPQLAADLWVLNGLGQGSIIQVFFPMENKMETTHTSHKKTALLQSWIFLCPWMPCQTFSVCFLTRLNADQSDSHYEG